MRRYLSPESFKFVAILLAVMFLLGAGLMAVEYTSSLPKPGDRLVEGRIVNIEVEKTTYHEFLMPDSTDYDTVLTIKILNTDTVVTTVMGGDWTNRIPDVVTFYYSGDPTQRVFLQQDTSPLVGVVLFLVMGLTVILGISVVLMLYKREERARHNQYKALLEKIKRS
ncbi:MAG: hypothetical protein WA821_23630 [Anaerolineales bacterium]